MGRLLRQPSASTVHSMATFTSLIRSRNLETLSSCVSDTGSSCTPPECELCGLLLDRHGGGVDHSGDSYSGSDLLLCKTLFANNSFVRCNTCGAIVDCRHSRAPKL